MQSDADIDAWVREAVESAYHPSCTCKMGSDEQAVVDAECKVRGLEGIRIADSSIMPSIVRITLRLFEAKNFLQG